MATAQHIGDHRTALGPPALPGLCQRLIPARGDMSEGKVRRVETTWHTHAKITQTYTRIQTCVHTDTPAYSSPLSLLAFLLKHKRTHWISSHSSWLEPPMAIAVGIHSPRMLGQLCWYWMRRSWFCLSLHAARDKNYMLLNSNLYSLLPKMHPTHLVFVSATTESSDFLCKKTTVNVCMLTHGGPQSHFWLTIITETFTNL